MNKVHTKVRSAFTLVEMILVIGMMAVISLAMVGVVHSTYQNWETLNNRSSLLLDGQAVTLHMTRILRQAKAITAVTEPTNQAGYITFTGVNDNTEEFRLNTATGELCYGDPDALEVLVAPVSNLVFTCYDIELLELTDLADHITDIRTVAFEATFVDPADGVMTVSLSGRVFIPTTGAAEDTSGGLLFVAADAANLTALETDRKTLIESWGYPVSLIADDAAQAVFDTAVADADVVYVPTMVDGNILASKLRGKAIGIVNEENKHRNNLGIAGSDVGTTVTDLEVTDNTHYITSPFNIGTLAVYTAGSENLGMSGSLAPGLTTLLEDGGIPTGRSAVGVLETGAQLNDGGSAAGRRVQLPWGSATFDINALTADGQTILRRSIEWAAAADSMQTGLLFVVPDATNLSSKETAGIALFETWGYTVTSINANAPQADFDTALADVEVAYIAGSISSNDLNTKLTAATVGVVSEDAGLVDEFGMAEPVFIKRNTQTLDIIDNTHYVTSILSLGDQVIFSSPQDVWTVNGTLGAGLEVLGETQVSGTGYPPGVAVLETGAALYGGGSAAGRRVQVPWSLGSGFDFSVLNTEGNKIMQRAIDWAAGADLVTPDTEMYVHDITMAWRKQGPRYYGQATVWVKDADGANVEGATVNGAWSGSVSGPDSGDTAADGTVMVESAGVNGGGTYIFTVNSIIKTGFTYNSALDVVSSGMIVAP